MTDLITPTKLATIKAGLKGRHRAEMRFQLYGLSAILIAVLFLGLMFTNIFNQGRQALFQTSVELDIFLDPAKFGPEEKRTDLTISRADYPAMVKASLRNLFPDVTKRREKKSLYKLISPGAAFDLRSQVIGDETLIGKTVRILVPASDELDGYMKANAEEKASLRDAKMITQRQVNWISSLDQGGRLKVHFNDRFFSGGDSREPELAGIWGAVMGSFFSLSICLALAFPLGLMTAIYLEEFARQNLFTDFIEVNINNLAAVPSIIFGLLGLAIFLNFMGLPRSAPLVGGMVLALMTLPTIIIAGRAALKSVPPSIREAALGIGASPMQVVLHHTLPLAMPGVLTGTIIGMARALGETAPLLLIGMVAFIVDVPGSIMDPATALPVQIYIWADSPERGFAEKTAAAIMVLLAFLVCMNLTAIYLRKKFEIRW